MLEPQAQQSKRHHHLAISHLISQHVRVWMRNRVCALAHTVFVLNDLQNSVVLFDISDSAICLGRIIQQCILFLLRVRIAVLMDIHSYKDLSCVCLSLCIPRMWCACASAPPSSQQRPSPLSVSSSCCSSPALHISPGENRPV